MKRLCLLLALAAASLFMLGAADSAAAAPKPFTLRPGSHGQHVRDLQWLLAGHRPAAFRYGYYDGRIDGRLGPKTARALRNTKWRLGYPTNAARQAVAGPLFFRLVEHKVQRPQAWRVAAGRRANRAVPWPEPRPVPTKAQTLVADARYLIAHRGRVHYSQSRRMEIVRYRLRLPPLHRPIWEDCSSSTTGLYWLAHLPDPNGLGYDGHGFTGTQARHGRIVWRLGQPLTRLRPGDLIFYGRGSFSHVTMYLGRGRVFSHGSEGSPYNLPVLYRGDAFYARRYLR